MSGIKTLLFKLSATLKAFGAWGLFGMAALDGAGVPLPGALDLTLAYMSADTPSRAWLYAASMALGSTLGCLVLYAIGYEGGEVLLRKRMSPEKFDKVRSSFEKHPILALGLPAMLPPPFPFKLTVFAAAVFEMRFTEFVVTVLLGRAVRFGVIAGLAALYGHQIVEGGMVMMKAYGKYVLLGMVVALAVWLLLRRRRRNLVATT